MSAKNNPIGGLDPDLLREAKHNLPRRPSSRSTWIYWLAYLETCSDPLGVRDLARATGVPDDPKSNSVYYTRGMMSDRGYIEDVNEDGVPRLRITELGYATLRVADMIWPEVMPEVYATIKRKRREQLQ